MNDYLIPIDEQAQLQERANFFKKKFVPKTSWQFVADARGKFVYLRRYMNDGSCQNLGRLIYEGNIENMAFSIYRYNTEKYDTKADFVGAHHLNGTLEGALKAILEAFP